MKMSSCDADPVNRYVRYTHTIAFPGGRRGQHRCTFAILRHAPWPAGDQRPHSHRKAHRKFRFTHEPLLSPGIFGWYKGQLLRTGPANLCILTDAATRVCDGHLRLVRPTHNPPRSHLCSAAIAAFSTSLLNFGAPIPDHTDTTFLNTCVDCPSMELSFGKSSLQLRAVYFLRDLLLRRLSLYSVRW